jgi:hypothetical protein
MSYDPVEKTVKVTVAGEEPAAPSENVEEKAVA